LSEQLQVQLVKGEFINADIITTTARRAGRERVTGCPEVQCGEAGAIRIMQLIANLDPLKAN